MNDFFISKKTTNTETSIEEKIGVKFITNDSFNSWFWCSEIKKLREISFSCDLLNEQEWHVYWLEEDMPHDLGSLISRQFYKSIFCVKKFPSITEKSNNKLNNGNKLSRSEIEKIKISDFIEDYATAVSIIQRFLNSINENAGIDPNIIFQESPSFGIAFKNELRSRTHLFEELKRVVNKNKIVFISGAYCDYVDEFMYGFQMNLNNNSDKQYGYRNVAIIWEKKSFPGFLRVIRSLYGSKIMCPELLALVISIAYSVLQTLVQEYGKKIIKDIEISKLEISHAFVSDYLIKTQAFDVIKTLSEGMIVKCLLEFLQSINTLCDKENGESQKSNFITIYMSLKDVMLLIHQKETVKKELVSGFIQFIRYIEDKTRYDKIGLVLSSDKIDLTSGTYDEFTKSILVIPPFSKKEIQNLIANYLGSSLSVEEFDLVKERIDSVTAGDHWFLYQLLAIIEIGIEENSGVIDSSITDNAINIFKHLVSDFQSINDKYTPIKENIISQKRKLIEILKVENISPVVLDDLLRLWKKPNFNISRWRNEESKLIEFGIFHPSDAINFERGESLMMLNSYPIMEIFPAGELPFEFLLNVKNGFESTNEKKRKR